MSFLGLGSFGEGFVKGFAESANDALKRDIERINGRIDKVAEIRTRRALDDQAKRRDKVDSTVDRLKQGAKVIGGPNGEAYAAGLLEEYGSAGYDALLTSLQQAKLDNEGIDIGSFFERAGVDAPGQAGGQTYTLRDYAEAYLGAPKTLPTSIKMPSDDSRVGGLVSKVLGVDVDIMGRAQDRSASEIAAMGISDKYDASIVIPRIKFNKFEFDMEILPFEQRLARIEEELTTASADEESPVDGFNNRQDYLRSLRDSTYTSYIENAPDLKKLELLQARRDSTTDASLKSDITKQINELSDVLRRRDAVKRGDDLAIMKMDASDAWAAGQKTGDYTEFEEQMLLINRRTTGKEETIPEQLSRLGSKLNTLTEGTRPYNEVMAEIDRLKKHSLTLIFEGSTAELARLTQEVAGMDRSSDRYKSIVKRMAEVQTAQRLTEELTESNFTTASAMVDDAIDREVALKLGAIGELYLNASRIIATGTKSYEELSVDLRNAYDQGKAMRNNLENDVFNRLMGVLDPEENPGMVAVGIYRGYITNPAQTNQTTGDTTTSDATSQTAAALSESPLPQADIDSFLSAYPDTGASGVDALLSGLQTTAQDALNDRLIQQAYGQEFRDELERRVEIAETEGSGEYQSFVDAEEEAAKYANPQQLEALKVIRNMPKLQQLSPILKVEELSKKLNITESAAKELVDSLPNVEMTTTQQIDQATDILAKTIGTKTAKTRAISSALNVSKDVAEMLYREATKNNRASGGLMSRS